jgi:hypothetical protein
MDFPKENHEVFMDTLGKKSPYCSTVKNGRLNLRGAGRALEMKSSLGGQKRTHMMILPKLCKLWSFATEGETCETLLGKWVSALVQFRQF